VAAVWGGTWPESKRSLNSKSVGCGYGECAAQGYKGSRSRWVETGPRRDRSSGTQAGPGHLWSFAWSAVFPMVSRLEAGFKAEIGTVKVSPWKIPSIPFLYSPVAQRPKQGYDKFFVGAAETGPATGVHGRNGLKGSRACIQEGASWRPRPAELAGKSPDGAIINSLVSCCRTGANAAARTLGRPWWR
jgi:hypothetical protein